mmetsp:Transcript_16223/g.50800  ORF Transcript_16223/g.50800 Transcript_16223/m.50800 type:complete len:209 (+) Transcript_16223:364-990(+)
MARPFDPYSTPLPATTLVAATAESSASDCWLCWSCCCCSEARLAPLLRCMRRAGGGYTVDAPTSSSARLLRLGCLRLLFRRSISSCDSQQQEQQARIIPTQTVTMARRSQMDMATMRMIRRVVEWQARVGSGAWTTARTIIWATIKRMRRKARPSYNKKFDRPVPAWPSRFHSAAPAYEAPIIAADKHNCTMPRTAHSWINAPENGIM